MKNNSYSISELIAPFPGKIRVVGDASQHVNGISTPDRATGTDIIFISKERKDKLEVARKTAARVIITTDEANEFNLGEKIFLITNDPKLIFSLIGNKFFNPQQQPGIDPTATIDKNAKIGRDVFIGPNVVIGENVEVGDYSVIYANVVIYKNTSIGKYVKIGANCSIAAEGFGYNKDEMGIPVQFPHIGGVILEDHVEIGCNTCIDRGSLGPTHLKQHVKVDNLVHIAHNVIIGRNSYIIANAMIGGSTVIGDNSWVAPSSSLRDAISIGDNTTVGMGAVIVKNMGNGEVWTGNPGKPLEEFKKLQAAIKKLINEGE